jgi:hypothetical protein
MLKCYIILLILYITYILYIEITECHDYIITYDITRTIIKKPAGYIKARRRKKVMRG